MRACFLKFKKMRDSFPQIEEDNEGFVLLCKFKNEGLIFAKLRKCTPQFLVFRLGLKIGFSHLLMGGPPGLGKVVGGGF